jgi:ubiquitin C-terminal hydrolase
MDENNLESKGYPNSIIKRINLSLKEENEDNCIDYKSNEEKEKKKSSNKKKDIKYKLDFDKIIENVKGRSIRDEEKEFYCNLMLMTSYIEISNKLNSLTVLATLCDKVEKNYFISNKIEKFSDFFNKIGSDFLYILNAYNLCANKSKSQKNFFYSFKYIKKCKNLIKDKSNIEKKTIEIVTRNYNNIEAEFINYIKNKEELFSNKKFYPEEKCKKIRELIDLIISEKYIIDSKENNNDYIYAINKEWLIKVKYFIEPYLTQIGGNSNNLIKGSFEPDYVYNYYFDEVEKTKNKNKSYPPYPGPINNFSLLSFNDCWEDIINLEENSFFKKNLEKNRDYIFVNSSDWNFLNQIFDCTYEIRRKINNSDLTQIKFILFDKRFLSKGNINLLKQKYIQINNNSTIRQLKDKILDCVNNEMNVNNNKKKRDICFYILNKDKRDVLIEIMISFVHKFQMYESIYIEKIEFKDDDNLKDLFLKYNPKKHILILEILKKDDFNFLLQMDNNYKCNICGENIKNLDNKYYCDLCNFSLFCSPQCAQNSAEHRELDNLLKNISEELFDVPNLLSKKFSSVLQRGAKSGRIGLKNIGNLCYFNSVLQCLSNTIDLTKYFLSNIYIKEIRQNNFVEGKGELAQAYYKLIDKMWNSYQEDYIDPFDFRNVFCRKTQLFLNQEQQDPCEFLLALLDNLSKDLNRVNNGNNNIKIEDKKENETEEQASDRWWTSHKSVNDSIIVDLFQGQFKTTIHCSSCDSTYTKYNIFEILDLPIPTKKSQNQIKLLTNNGNYIEFNIKIDETTYVKDAILKSIEYLNKNNYINLVKKMNIKDNLFNYNISEVPEKILYDNMQFIELSKDLKIINIFKPNYNCININIKGKNKNLKGSPFDNLKLLDFNSKKNILLLYEKDINSNLEDYIDVYVYPFTEVDSYNMFMKVIKTHKILSYPILISIKKTDSLKNLNILIYKKLRKILYNQGQNELTSFEICYPHFNDKWESFKIKDGICPICKKLYDKNTKYCSLFNTFTENNSIFNLINNNKDIPLIFYAKSFFYNPNACLYNGIELFLEKKNEIESKKHITIYDSLEALTSQEILDGDNMWNCKICNKKRKAEKKVELYKTPNYLIIQLKRFKQKKNVNGKSVLGNKNDTFIEYKEILNLKDFVIGPEKNKSIYDLYGIIIHKKFMNTHFISYCKNLGVWINYDDVEINAVENLFTKDAYLLFYKKRN